MGQNWVVGDILSKGDRWADVHTPTLYGYPFTDPPKSPVTVADRDLLIWIAPAAGAPLQVVEGPRHSWYNNNYLNLPNRVWAPRQDSWQANSSHFFTTVLVPHKPEESSKEIAAGIAVVEDHGDATVLRIKLRGEEYLVAMGAPGHGVSEGPLKTEAEAAVVRVAPGTPAVSAWGASAATLDGKRIGGG
jgi:hypothetical protein